MKKSAKAKSVRADNIVIDKYEGPDFNRGASSYICSSLVRFEGAAEDIRSHVYLHKNIGGELVSDIIFFTPDTRVTVGCPFEVFDDKGARQITGKISEILD